MRPALYLAVYQALKRLYPQINVYDQTIHDDMDDSDNDIEVEVPYFIIEGLQGTNRRVLSRYNTDRSMRFTVSVHTEGLHSLENMTMSERIIQELDGMSFDAYGWNGDIFYRDDFSNAGESGSNAYHTPIGFGAEGEKQ